MQLRYVFTELRQGLRRNLSMHIAVVLTLFVSLTLVGLGVLLNQQADKTAEHLGNELQIIVFLCRDGDRATPPAPVRSPTRRSSAIERGHRGEPRGRRLPLESKEEAFEKAKELYGDRTFEGADAAMTVGRTCRSRYWITLKDPDEAEGITSAVQGLDGVAPIRDQRERSSRSSTSSTR